MKPARVAFYWSPARFSACAYMHALKREMKANSYGDTGKQWNAIPEQMRKAIENFNALPKEARPIVLGRMRQNMVCNPQVVEKLAQQLGQVKEQTRDRSMGL